MAFVLGSGLGGLAGEVEASVVVPFDEIPGFVAPRVAGHRGRVIGGMIEQVPSLIFEGRFHPYQGHDPALAALPTRVAAALGAPTLFVANAAGAINRSFEPGDLMLIDDHIDLMARNPLIGPATEREPDRTIMPALYDRDLRELAQSVATRERLRLRRGVYAAMLGPSYETPAEIRMLDRMGADAVGMSTVPEVLAAGTLGLRVLGISLITNPAAGLSRRRLSHDDVIRTGDVARTGFIRFLRALVRASRTSPRGNG